MNSVKLNIVGILSGGGGGGEKNETIDTRGYFTVHVVGTDATAHSALFFSGGVGPFEYCVDGDGVWKSVAMGGRTEEIYAGHCASFRAQFTPQTNKGIGVISGDPVGAVKYAVSGNIMSLLYGDNAESALSLADKPFAFYRLFHNWMNYDITGLRLPATTLSLSCYEDMFYGGGQITGVPVLPATSLAESCYFGMFYGCTGLTAAPALPATTLARRCYRKMFYNCTGLKTAPVLPATTLDRYCYMEMFSGCSKLSYVNAQFTSDPTMWQNTQDWLKNTPANGVFVKNSQATWDNAAAGIPESWTVVTV